MNAVDESIAGKSQLSLSGKVIGVIKNYHQLQSLRNSLGALELLSLQSLEKIPRLNAWQETISKYFFGDMECKMLQRYLDALNGGQIVFAADVDPESAEKVSQVANQHGAFQVVCFEDPVIANLLTSVLSLT